MKKIFYTTLFLLIFITFISCSSESTQVENFGKVKLRFENESSNLNKDGDTIIDFRDVEVYIKSLSPFKLESEEIEELSAKDSITNADTYGYVIKNLRYGVEHGYFFNSGSGCFHYGTMYYGDNGVNLFVPASYLTQIAFYPTICPPAGQAYAKTKK